MITSDFLLDTPQAKKLFHDFCENLPIIDFHSHLDARVIASNKKFDNIAQLWLDGDHYKWRAMRTNGIEEKFCSGNASDREKYDAWAKVVPLLLRNPLYHWTHLELRRPFGITGTLFSTETADEIWDKTREQLGENGIGACDILKKMKVEVACTTDDPCDDLSAHKKIAGTPNAPKVLPTFRADKARQIANVPAWNAWVDKLAEVCGNEISTFSDFKKALRERHDYFAKVGCKLSDASVEYAEESALSNAEAETLFAKARNGGNVSQCEFARFSNTLLEFFADLDFEKNWTRQLHVGALRNPNSAMMEKLGPDTGFDAIADVNFGATIAKILDRSAAKGALPKTILYNLNPRDNEMLAVLVGSFQDGSIAGKIQFGAAWWFLDQMDGITRHIEALSQLGTLSRFVGMLTDSRSLLSYTRHEYFRRILCRILGRDMEAGLIPDDIQLVGKMVADISYYNAKNYFLF